MKELTPNQTKNFETFKKHKIFVLLSYISDFHFDVAEVSTLLGIFAMRRLVVGKGRISL